MNDAVDRHLRDARQVGAFDKAVDGLEAIQRFLDARVGEVGSPKDLVAVMDRVFLRRDQDVVELPGMIGTVDGGRQPRLAGARFHERYASSHALRGAHVTPTVVPASKTGSSPSRAVFATKSTPRSLRSS